MTTDHLLFSLQAVCKDNGFFDYLIPSWFTTTKHIKPLTQRLCSLEGLLCSKTQIQHSLLHSVTLLAQTDTGQQNINLTKTETPKIKEILVSQVVKQSQFNTDALDMLHARIICVENKIFTS